MAEEARPHFCVDEAHRQSYREGLVGASCTPPQSCQTRSAVANALGAKLSAPSTTSRLIAHISCDQRVRLQVTRFGVGVTPHPRSSSRRADFRSARLSALQCLTNVCSGFAGVLMEYVEHADARPGPISIARCRELLGEDAKSMSDQEVEEIRRHAEAMACIVVEMYQDQVRASE
jgi:hypothetical protein